jgi:hypothetical protein
MRRDRIYEFIQRLPNSKVSEALVVARAQQLGMFQTTPSKKSGSTLGALPRKTLRGCLPPDPFAALQPIGASVLASTNPAALGLIPPFPQLPFSIATRSIAQ